MCIKVSYNSRSSSLLIFFICISRQFCLQNNITINIRIGCECAIFIQASLFNYIIYFLLTYGYDWRYCMYFEHGGSSRRKFTMKIKVKFVLNKIHNDAYPSAPRRLATVILGLFIEYYHTLLCNSSEIIKAISHSSLLNDLELKTQTERLSSNLTDMVKHKTNGRQLWRNMKQKCNTNFKGRSVEKIYTIFMIVL